MATSGISSDKSQKTCQSVRTALTSAVLEWLLICMLFIDAILSYLITKFACYYELQTPCLVCSRLDHILGNKKFRKYWDLICGKHKLEISSLVLCHAHNELADVHGMCETCLFSFATINKSNAETYRLVVGKWGEGSSFDLNDVPLLDDQMSSLRHCSCCNEPCIRRRYSEKLMETKIVGSKSSDFDGPLSDGVEYKQENVKKIERSVSVIANHQRINSEPDHLSHMKYAEVNVVTSILPRVSIGRCSEECDLLQADVKYKVSVFPADEVPTSTIAKESPVDVSEESKHSFLEGVPPSLNAKETCVEPSNGSTLMSIEDVPSSSIVRETPLVASEKSQLISADDVHQSLDSKEIPDQISTSSKVVSPTDVLPLSSAVETAVQEMEENYSEEICKTRTTSATMTETAAETNPVSSDNGVQVPNLLDLGDAYRLAIGSRGRQLSGALAEQWIGKDSSRLADHIKILLSQLSAAREQSLNDTSPRVPASPGVSASPKLSVNSDEFQNVDASSVIGMQRLQKRISLERNESDLSLDGSMVSEIEGESLVDRLKRQIEHDKRLLSALYKELEEERNASAIAANQTMAMITRLQEEKATLQMEALQYLRMMEEQAEYDMEALQKTNDLLAEREKELKDLEAELEFYRNNPPRANF